MGVKRDLLCLALGFYVEGELLNGTEFFDDFCEDGARFDGH